MNSRFFESAEELPCPFLSPPQFYEKEEEDPNKENIDPFNKILTPLKQRVGNVLSNSNQSSNKNSNRSPLQDITPMTMTTGKKNIRKSPNQNQVNFKAENPFDNLL